MSSEPSIPPPLSRSRRTGSFPSRRRGPDLFRQYGENVRHVSPRGRYNTDIVAEPDEFDLYSESPYPDLSRQGYRSLNHGAYEQHMMPPWHYGPEVLAYPGPRLRSSSRPATDISMVDDSQSRTRSRRKRFSTDTSLPGRSPSERLVRFAPSVRSASPSAPRDEAYEYVYESAAEPNDNHSSSEVDDYGYDYGDNDDDDDEGFDEHIGGRVFQFVPSRTSRMATKGTGSITEDSSTNTDDGSTTSLTRRSLQVFQSRYTGDAVPDGTHTTKLTIIHDPKKQRQPLFRWMHLEQQVMNFDEFSAEVSRIPSITDSERSGFTKLLTEVKRNHVKVRPTSKGSTVRHMDPRPVRVAISPEGRAKDQTSSKSLTWLCVPYFSLEKYSGLLSTHTPSSFPIETLLQSEYARTTQEREMQQVVCQNGEAPGSHCFHIAQLWCIVLDNTLLITCGRMSSTSLRGDSIQIITEPIKQPELKMKTIYVSYYDSVLWAFPLESCMTWFDFSIHFREFWPQAVKISHHGRLITGDDWLRIINLVRYSNTKITLDLRLGSHPQPPVTGILKPLGKSPETADKAGSQTAPRKGDVNSKDISPDTSDDMFHVFTWVDMADTDDSPRKVDMEALINQLTEVEEYLLGSTAAGDRKTYQGCHCSSRRLVYKYLEGKGSGSEKDQEPEKKNDKHEDAVDIFNAADIIYEFFLPHGLEDDIPTVGKFWGAIQALIEVESSDFRGDEDRTRRGGQPVRRGVIHSNVHQIKSSLRETTRIVQSFQDVVSQASQEARNKIEVPDGLIRAWLHLIMALIQAASNREVWRENMNVSEALIRRGMNDIIDDLSAASLLDYSVVQPMELVALLGLKLLHDSTGKYSSINDTYSEYLKGLENEITTKDSNRVHQLRLTLFKQEVSVIRRVIASQIKVVVAMNGLPRLNWADQTRKEKEMLERERDKSKMDRTIQMRYYEKQPTGYVDRIGYHHAPTDIITRGMNDFDIVQDPDGFAKLSATDPGGFRELFTRECRAWLDRRENEFLELAIEASRLETMNTNKIEVTKDRQEAAVYAFTMVTIIFLPLSTISSIFGMNSSDVRDMDAGQWAYWATAVPTTLLVIVAGLWWMGELRNLLNWMRGIPSSTSSPSSSAPRWSGRIGGNGGVYASMAPPPALASARYYREGGAPYAGMETAPTPAMVPYAQVVPGQPIPRTSWRY